LSDFVAGGFALTECFGEALSLGHQLIERRAGGMDF